MTDRNRDTDVDRNVVADVEFAELGPDIARKVGEPVERRRAPAPEMADQDLVVERKDLGPDSSTFIAKGSPIPTDLVGLPRRPVRGDRKK